MREKIYNLFVFVEGKMIVSLGVVVHDCEGDDEQKLRFLQSKVKEDFLSAQRYLPSNELSTERYEALMRLDRQLEVFEEIFVAFGAPNRPLCAVTTIEDGAPRIEAALEHGPTTLSRLKGTSLGKPGEQVDWMEKYIKNKQFDLPQLINDDYFEAIKLLFNNGFLVSASKLLMSCVDSIAFIEYGDEQSVFCKWLKTYADLAPLGITPEEIWEFRNGLLHMTNLHSRAVRGGKTKAIIIYSGPNVPHLVMEAPGTKRVNFKVLLTVVADAIGQWTLSYSGDQGKMLEFVERYDLTISDSRKLIITLEDE